MPYVAKAYLLLIVGTEEETEHGHLSQVPRLLSLQLRVSSGSNHLQWPV